MIREVLVFFERFASVPIPPIGHAWLIWLRDLLGCEWIEELRDTRSVIAFDGVEEGDIDLLVKRAALRDSRYSALRRVFPRLHAVACPTTKVANLLVAALRNSGGVEYAEVGLALIPSLLPERRPANEATNQEYLHRSPKGVDALYAWRFPGGRGNGVRFVDIEQAWHLEHADLIEAGITLVEGEPGVGADPEAIEHGTAVLGIIAAGNDDQLVVGIAHEVVSVRVVSMIDPQGMFNLPRAILFAIRELRFGDVLLMEADAPSDKGRVPAEIKRSVFELIRLATARGIVVVEPAGNGGVDLDSVESTEMGFCVQPLNRAGRIGFRDSGALVVGGCLSEDSHPPLPASGYGSRVDCYAWAMDVVTTGYLDVYLKFAWGGTLLTRRLLEACAGGDILITEVHEFSGTSSASAIIAGVAVCVQSLAQANLGFRFSPWQLRLLLSDPVNGTKSKNPKVDLIGIMPDLRKIIQRVLRLTAREKGLLLALPRSACTPSGNVLLTKVEFLVENGFLLLPFFVFVAKWPCQLRVEILSRLPRSARVWLEMPHSLADLKGIWKIPKVKCLQECNVFVPANPNGQTYFREANFPAESAWRLVLEGAPADGKTYKIAVRVMDGWSEVARETWNVPPGQPAANSG
jgi:Subtilase family